MATICNTCCRPVHSPFRSYDQSGNIVHGCIDDCHTGHLVTPSASAHWHNRKEAKAWRVASAKRLRELLA